MISFVKLIFTADRHENRIHLVNRYIKCANLGINIVALYWDIPVLILSHQLTFIFYLFLSLLFAYLLIYPLCPTFCR